jgi:hypothetical protein
MGRGRPKSPGKRYYIGRIRFDPRYDPPELQDLLEAITTAPPGRKAILIKAALLEGRNAAIQEANKTEDDIETDVLLQDLFG